MKSIGPIIEKTEAFIISEIFEKSENSIIYIGKDDREVINIYNKLFWLLPKQKKLLYKAWDQIPYDNISPSKEVQTSRLETLYYLNSNKEEKLIVLTTINATTNNLCSALWGRGFLIFSSINGASLTLSNIRQKILLFL